MTMSRTQAIMNRIELVAAKLKISIEEVIDIVEGKHPTVGLAAKPVQPVNITEPGQTTSKPPIDTDAPQPVITAASIAAAPAAKPVAEAPVPDNTPKMATKPVAGALEAAKAAGVKVTS